MVTEGYYTCGVVNTQYNIQMMYKVCPEGTQPCDMKRETFIRKIPDTRNIVHKTMTPQSPSK